MTKRYLRDKTAFENWRRTVIVPNWPLSMPSFPCIVVWYIDEDSALRAKYVYLNDFEEAQKELDLITSKMKLFVSSSGDIFSPSQFVEKLLEMLSDLQKSK